MWFIEVKYHHFQLREGLLLLQVFQPFAGGFSWQKSAISGRRNFFGNIKDEVPSEVDGKSQRKLPPWEVNFRQQGSFREYHLLVILVFCLSHAIVLIEKLC